MGMLPLLLAVGGGHLVSQRTDMIPCYVYTGGANNWQPAPITNAAENSGCWIS